jgi:hypothetical protein
LARGLSQPPHEGRTPSRLPSDILAFNKAMLKLFARVPV